MIGCVEAVVSFGEIGFEEPDVFFGIVCLEVVDIVEITQEGKAIAALSKLFFEDLLVDGEFHFWGE